MCVPLERVYPLLFLHQTEEIAQELVLAQGRPRAEDDQLFLCPGEGDIDPAPVS
jgi:hypothetical protein